MTKFLGQRSNDIVVTMFQNLDTTVTKFLGDYDITIIEFLNTVLPKYLEDNDISVTKFLDKSVGSFLEQNDITVTKFMDDNDISVTKFLKTDTAVSNYPFKEGDGHTRRHAQPLHHDTEYHHMPGYDTHLPEGSHRAYDRPAEHYSRHGADWEDDLYYGGRRHEGGRHYFEGGDHHHEMEHARTVYPHDYPHTPHGDYRYDAEHVREHDY